MSDHDHLGLKDAPSLIRQMIDHARSLIRTEAELAKREIKNNISKAAMGIVFLVIAALLALTALNVLAAVGVIGLIELGVTPFLSTLIVLAAFLVLAAILALVGKGRLSASTLKPDRTITQIEADVNAIKGATRG